ncbi:MAG: hypothetical protein QNJ55_05720 [Xenococcus sp. MO_188.B8]|nr:hypothetical protein [Xenococcus sp. MO_188.B8]
MLYLAQVQKNPISHYIELQTLACQITENVWEVNNSDVFPLAKDSSLGEGVLVLVERQSNGEIISIQEAKEWLLSLLQQYLTKNAINPQFVAAEQDKVERWRQEITSQNLELNRRFLEIETRREELQQLEQSLKHEKEELEELAKKLQK